jgi:hypothetical protein
VLISVATWRRDLTRIRVIAKRDAQIYDHLTDKMSILKIALMVFLLFSIKSMGQNSQFDYGSMAAELLRNKKLIEYADSTNKLGEIGILSNDVFKIIETLDTQHPVGFFQKAGAYLELLQPNEASFLYYTGYLRYKYYNSVNPQYQIGNDGALFASLMAALQEPLTLYLRANVDNYIEILKKSSDWHLNHDYGFFSRDKNQEKYLEETNKIKSLISDLETNKSRRQLEWSAEQKVYLNNLDSIIGQVDKNSSNKKSGVGDNKMIQQDMTYINSDSLMFCGEKIKSPKDCQMVMPGMVNCRTFAMVWNYEPVKDIDRHKKEGLAQLKKPMKFRCYILGTKVTAYQAKLEDGVEIQVYEVVKGQGLLLSIYILNKDKVTADNDIPEFIGQVFKMKKIK